MQKFSIITAVFNRAETILNAVNSVQAQTYTNTEHVVVDGASTDGTVDILKQHLGVNTVFLSESDKGIYDALNKGIALATGDIIGFMHSDDSYANVRVLETVARAFEASDVDGVYADVLFFHPAAPDKPVRRYRSDRFSADRLAWGWMPAHTTLFLRRRVYEQYGYFKSTYKIAADFEFIVRILADRKIKLAYIPEVLVHMNTGGASTAGLKSTIRLNQEVKRACAENGIRTNWFKILSKYPLKMLEYIRP